MRKQGSLFSTVVNYINTVPVGKTYKVAHQIKETRGVEYVTWWKSRNDEAYRTRTYQTYLKRLGFLKNVKRGEWQVVAHIPEWLDLGVANYALSYNRWNYDTNTAVEYYKGKNIQQWQTEIKNCIEKNQNTVNMNAPQPGESLVTFDCMDPLKACIELRKIGVLAVPVNEKEIELHVLHKNCAEDLANWMMENGYEIEDYPELEDLVGAYFPDEDEHEHDEPCECEKVYVTVLNYTTGEVNVFKVPSDEVFEFLEETYGDNFDDTTEYMTSEELKLNLNF